MLPPTNAGLCPCSQTLPPVNKYASAAKMSELALERISHEPKNADGVLPSCGCSRPFTIPQKDLQTTEQLQTPMWRDATAHEPFHETPASLPPLYLSLPLLERLVHRSDCVCVSALAWTCAGLTEPVACLGLVVDDEETGAKGTAMVYAFELPYCGARLQG